MELKFILESLLFSAQKPLSVKELRDVFAAAAEAEDADATVKSLKKIKEEDVTAALETLAREHETAEQNGHDERQKGQDAARGPAQIIPVVSDEEDNAGAN